MCFAPQRSAIFADRNLQNVLGTVSFFQHFHLQMCFAPQRRAIFADGNFQNASDKEVFRTF